MNGDPGPQALLKDLHQLSEAGRDRFLKLLPREDIIEAFKAALLEWDVDQNLKAPTGESHKSVLY